MMSGDLLRELRELQLSIRQGLATSAAAYYRVGLLESLRVERQPWMAYQAAVGNLAIAIELMLKAFVAFRCFRKLYIAVPEKLDVMLTSETPPPSLSLRPFENGLRSFEYRTIELDQAIAIYCMYFPDQKTELHSYFSLLAMTRNVSVHGALADFQRFDLARVSYLAIKLMQHLTSEQVVVEPMDLRTKAKRIVEGFDRERAERVKNKIKKARVAAKKLTGHKLSIILSQDDFDAVAIPCPICGSDVYVSGYTQPDGYDESPSLLFYPDSFACQECGLEIADSREFPLVGLETVIDRTDDLDEWAKLHAEWE